ncbi:MAG TPA: ABC transporter ATP-binding protein, partial [Mariniflexile sp.]
MRDNEVLVKVEGLSKKFCKDLKTSLWYGVKDLISNIRGNKNERLLRDKEFWAVKDINFELHRGECLGLIGHNGAGKSTLLKILNGLINPDAGKVTIKGRVGALIELGAGFNPILSGRENIYNNGAVLGFTKKEIDAKVEEIIDFAEIREFIDMPVQNYSSGMKVRLGFAVAAQMEPDVLIIDEVLAVGDLGFRMKCFKTIDTILPHTAIIFVSHSMPIVSRVCTQIILMELGKSKYQGDDIAKAIDLYYSRFTNNEA